MRALGRCRHDPLFAWQSGKISHDLRDCAARESGCKARMSMLDNSRFGGDERSRRGLIRITGESWSGNKKKVEGFRGDIQVHRLRQRR